MDEKLQLINDKVNDLKSLLGKAFDVKGEICRLCQNECPKCPVSNICDQLDEAYMNALGFKKAVDRR